LSKKQPAGPRRGPDKWGRERRRRHIIEIVIAITIVAVVAIVTYGLYDSRIKPWHQTVVRVNETVFDMNYFVKLLRLYAGKTPQTPEEFQQLWNMAQQQLPEVMINNELKKQGAAARGIYPTRQEIDDKFWEFFSALGDQDDAETLESYREILDRLNVSDSDLRELWFAPIVIEEQLREYMGNERYPEDGEFDHVNVQAALFGVEEDAVSARALWEESGFENMINSTIHSRQYPPEGSDEEWLPRGIEDVDFDEFAFEHIGLLSGPVHDTTHYTNGGYWLFMVVDKRVIEGVEQEVEELQIKAILFDSKSMADEVAGMYDGENFAELAEEYSLDNTSKDNGGDVGWMSVADAKSRFGPDVETIGLNELSNPSYNTLVSKQSGYWIIKVLANEERPLTESNRIMLGGQLFNDWILAERESDENRIENLLDAEKDPGKSYDLLSWAIDHLDIKSEVG